MRFVFTPNGWEDYTFWQSTDRATLKRINRLLDDIARQWDLDPGEFTGRARDLRQAVIEAKRRLGPSRGR